VTHTKRYAAIARHSEGQKIPQAVQYGPPEMLF